MPWNQKLIFLATPTTIKLQCLLQKILTIFKFIKLSQFVVWFFLEKTKHSLSQQKLTLSKEKDPLLTKLEIFQSQFGTSNTVLTFGDKPTPAMAQIALRKTADKAKSSYPEAAQVLKNNTYMDDICDSVNSIKQAKRLTNELDEVSLKVKGWLSNQSLENKIVGQEKPEMKVLRRTTQEKILGTVWDHAKDMLLFNVNPPHDITLTKRIVLSQISRIFDPVRFAAAFLVCATIGTQRLWQQGLDWHQELPPAAQEEWSRFYQEMGDLNHVTFERSLIPEDATALPILCIFPDASNEAFGACAYFTWRTESNEYVTRFIAAKSRVDYTPPRATSSGTAHQAISVHT